jgi:WD40 repeat protein
MVTALFPFLFAGDTGFFSGECGPRHRLPLLRVACLAAVLLALCGVQGRRSVRPPPQGTVRARLKGRGGFLSSVAFSPDGTLLASGELGQGEGVINLWEVARGTPRATLRGHDGSINAVAISPDGRTLASGGVDRTIWLWEVATGKTRATLWGHPAALSQVTFSPDGKTLAAASQDGVIKLWDIATGRDRRAGALQVIAG